MNKKKLYMRGGKFFSVPIMLTTAFFSATIAMAVVPLPLGVNNPPTVYTVAAGPAAGQTTGINIIAFPQRDFVHLAGFAPDDVVDITVTHDPALYPGLAPLTTSGLTPDSTDPLLPAGGNSVIEVNHPGGSCWNGTTPDIRAGDLIEVDVVAGTNIGRKDATYVANITAKRPIAIPGDPTGVQVHGTAQNAAGAQLPIAELEHRLIAPGSIFAASGARTLRANNAGDTKITGSLNYDAVGSLNWTASYTGLSPADVTTALGADSDGLWLGNATAPAIETTQYEVGPAIGPGPAAPCSAPLEVLPPPAGSELTPPTAPTGLIATFDGINSVSLNWIASTDPAGPPGEPAPSGVAGYGIYRNGQLIFTVANADGSPDPITVYTDQNIPPGTYIYKINAIDGVGNVSLAFSNERGPFDVVSNIDPNTFPVPINDPPVLPTSIIAFPSRDFISPSGYLETDKVSVQVIRDGIIISSADNITPQDDGTGLFFAEVNHPGGACWAGLTPELREGDVVRTIAYNPTEVVPTPGNPLSIRTVDQTHVSGVTALRPVIVTPENGAGLGGVVEIHGTAMGPDGKPIPLGNIEQRMIAKKDAFDSNGKRAIRAAFGLDGTLAYDPVHPVNNPLGINWTARYSGLSCDDVKRIAGGTCAFTGTQFAGADTRIHWLGKNPLTLAEATIYENADGNPPGPAAPNCTPVTSPLENPDIAPPSAPGSFQMTVDDQANSSATFTWSTSSDDKYVAGYRIYDNGRPVADVGSTTDEFGKNIPLTYILTGIPAGNHTYQLAAYDTASAMLPPTLGGDIVAKITAGFGLPYGNVSDLASSNTVTRTQSDVTAPSVPLNLVATVGNTVLTAHDVALTWTASTDDVGVDHYNVYRDGTQVGTKTTASFNETVAAAGSYAYTVEAVDLAGNTSAQSAPLTATVQDIPDTSAPTPPTGVTATVINPNPNTGRDVRVNWTSSTDDVAVAGYNIYRKSVLTPDTAPLVNVAVVNASTVSYTDPALPSGTYQYAVEAFDSAGNKSAQSALTTSAIIANLSPTNGHAVFAFPARDFISATGYNYTPLHNFHFELYHTDGTSFKSVQWQNTPGDTTGTVEVNHPGGACWQTTTPEMRAGDIVRIVDETTGVADQTVVANVTAERPIVSGNSVIIHGTAKKADGSPIPVEQLESRLIASTQNPFANGKRTLRAANGGGVDGTLNYDAPGSTNWTATYPSLSSADLVVSVSAESRGIWLGNNPLALAEGTFWENGAGVTGGPAAAGPGGASCPAAEVPQGAVNVPLAAVGFGNIQFLPLPVATSGPQTVTISAQNLGAGNNLPFTVSNIYFSGLNTGDFTRTGGTCLATPFTLDFNNPLTRSCTVTFTFKPLAFGPRQAALSFTTTATNTTDTSIPLTGFGADNTKPSISATPSPFNFGPINGGLFGQQVFTVTNTSADLTGIKLNINSAAIGGTNASDFTVSGNTCPVAPAEGLGAGGTCSITVQFRPGARTTRAGTLTLAHTTTTANTSSTVINLSGSGGNGSTITLSPTPTVTYGTVTRSTTKTQSISIQNTGNAGTAGFNLSVTSTPLVIGGLPFSNYFKIQSNTCGATVAADGLSTTAGTGTIAAGGKCSATVAFVGPNAISSNFAGVFKVTTTNGMPLNVTTNLTAATR